VFKPNKEGGW